MNTRIAGLDSRFLDGLQVRSVHGARTCGRGVLKPVRTHSKRGDSKIARSNCRLPNPTFFIDTAFGCRRSARNLHSHGAPKVLTACSIYVREWIALAGEYITTRGIVVKKRNLGKSGLEVSIAGLGCNNFGWNSDVEGARKVVHRALDVGITLFDTADYYGGRGGSETMLGQILGDRRKDVIVATKFGMPMDDAETLKGASRRYVLLAVEASLRRLKTDWIDLYQVHQPDPLTPIEETLRALDDLIRQGKVRYSGCSNHRAWRVVEAQWSSRNLGINAFSSCQDEYSLLVRKPELELLPAMEAYGLGLLPYFPLASGLLTGKYKRDQMPEGARLTKVKGLADRYLTDANWQIVDRLEGFCARRGHTMIEVAFSWLLSKPIVSSVIAGATKPEQVDQNVQAANCALTPDELVEIDHLTDQFSGPGA